MVQRVTSLKNIARWQWTVIGLIVGGCLLGIGWFGAPWLLNPLTLRPGETVKSRLTVAPGIHHIGDPIKVTLEIQARPGLQVYPLGLAKDSITPFELISPQTVQREWHLNGTRQTVQWQLTAWQVGRFTLPGPMFTYIDRQKNRYTKRSPQLTVAVTSVLPVRESRKELLKLPLKGIKKPLPLPPQLLYLWGLLLLLVIVAAVYGVIRYCRLRRARPEPTPVTEPKFYESPAQIALRRLTALENSGLVQSGEFKQFYIELSEIARQYIEARYQIKALEMTTEEFLALIIGNTGHLKLEHQFMIKEFLHSADLVKFAKHIPLPENARQDLARIRQLVLETQAEPFAPERNEDSQSLRSIN